MRTFLGIALAWAAWASGAQAQEQIRLDHPVRRITGVVQKANGETVPNIDIEVFAGQSLIAATKTNSHGKFAAEAVEPGAYEVWFTYKPHPVFKDLILKVTVDPKGSKEPIVVKLSPL